MKQEIKSPPRVRGTDMWLAGATKIIQAIPISFLGVTDDILL
jgi:hypothetical protein